MSYTSGILDPNAVEWKFPLQCLSHLFLFSRTYSHFVNCKFESDLDLRFVYHYTAHRSHL